MLLWCPKLALSVCELRIGLTTNLSLTGHGVIPFTPEHVTTGMLIEP